MVCKAYILYDIIIIQSQYLFAKWLLLVYFII